MSTTTTRCGKSRLLDLVEALCHRPILTANASPSAVYRCIGEDHTDPSTLLIDEADTIFGPRANDADEDLRGLLNAGHQRGRPAIRYDAGGGPDRHLRHAALAGIGNMPDTIEDRAVIVGMRRRAPDETVLPFRTRRDGPALAQLKTQAARLGPRPPRRAGVRGARAARRGPGRRHVGAVGGDRGPRRRRPWPADARAAVLALATDDVDVDVTCRLRVPLLIDIRTAFRDAERVLSDTLVARLREIFEAPWDTLGKKGLNPKSLAGLLRDFGIHSVEDRWDGAQARGFKREQFGELLAPVLPRATVPGALPSQPSQRHTRVKMRRQSFAVTDHPSQIRRSVTNPCSCCGVTAGTEGAANRNSHLRQVPATPQLRRRHSHPPQLRRHEMSQQLNARLPSRIWPTFRLCFRPHARPRSSA